MQMISGESGGRGLEGPFRSGEAAVVVGADGGGVSPGVTVETLGGEGNAGGGESSRNEGRLLF